jgi:predicted phage terminase large subunit-like protein
LTKFEIERQRRRAKAELEEVRKNADVIREECKSLYAFVKRFWSVLEPGSDFVGGRAIEELCRFLEAVTDDRIQYLLITIPPGMMKSLLVSVFWPAWEWGPRALVTKRYLTSSFSRPNVIRDNNKMRRLVESERYQELWSHVRPSNKWGEETFENTATGGRQGRAFESMTGGRGDRVIIDDPHSVDSAESPTQRQSVVKTFREAIPDRLNDLRKSKIVVIMQRLHEKDVAGTILELELPYVHLNLPMEFEPRRVNKETGKVTGGPCEVYLPGPDGEPELFFRDWRTEEGELLFPERFPADKIADLKKAKGSYAWAGQYQQRPTARDGGMFKRQWFEGKIIDRSQLPKAARIRCRAWDRAGSKIEVGKVPDYSASVKMLRHGTDYYIEHVERFRDTPGNIRRRMMQSAETDPLGTIIRIPQDPGQAGVDQKERDAEYFAGYRLSFHKPSQNKELRAEPFAVQCEFGHVYIVRGEWVDDFLDELCTFPAGANDDMVDAAADAFTECAGAKTGGFEGETAGARVTTQQSSRDKRYNFGDIEGTSARSDGFSISQGF